MEANRNHAILNSTLILNADSDSDPENALLLLAKCRLLAKIEIGLIRQGVEAD